MADMEWFKNLAEANFVNGKWHFDDPEKVEQLLSFKVKTTMNQIFDEVQDAIEIYNQHAQGGNKISTLPIADNYSNTLVGVVALLGTSQVKLIRKNQNLELYLVDINGHSAKTSLINKLAPCYDSLGSLMWQTKDKNLVGQDIIVKMMLEDLVKAASSNL